MPISASIQKDTSLCLSEVVRKLHVWPMRKLRGGPEGQLRSRVREMENEEKLGETVIRFFFFFFFFFSSLNYLRYIFVGGDQHLRALFVSSFFFFLGWSFLLAKRDDSQ